VEFKLLFKNCTDDGLSKTVIVFASTFELTPPPVKYLTVNVVEDGAIPYVFVNIKLEGE
jgi:hypothetical protein